MSWKKMKLGDVLKNREGRYKPNDPTIAYLKRIDKINFSGQIFLSDKSSNTDMILIRKGDLVLSGINVEKGALAVYEGEEDILATIHYSSYIFDTSKIDIDFLKVFLRSPDFVQLLKEQVPGGIKTEIKPKHILPLEVYFPETTTEQKVIAEHFFEKEAKFNQLDEHISYQLSQLENLNQAILQEAVQGKLVKQDPNDEPASELLKRIKAEKAVTLSLSKGGKKEKPFPPIKPEEIPFEIPESWVWCRLGEIANHSLGKMLDENKNRGEFKPYLRNINVQWFKFDLSDIKQMKFLDSETYKYSAIKGDILICEGGYPGRAAIWEEEDVIMFQKALHRVRFVNRSFNEKLFVFYLWLINGTDFFKFYLTGSGIQHFTGKKLNTLPIPLPPLSEQKRIVAEIERQFAKTKQLKENIITNQQATEQLLKALLYQAFEARENDLLISD